MEIKNERYEISMSADEIKDLQELMQGGTVLKVSRCKESESVCTFYVEKNGERYNFTLYGTDLGHWVSKKRKYRNNHV
jgi:hypothetical protein